MSGGYEKGDPLELVSSLPPGTEIAVTPPTGERWQGWLLPHDPMSGPRAIQLKLPSGYNVGVHLPVGSTMEVLPGPLWGEPERRSPTLGDPDSANPTSLKGAVVILTTGGTIASRVDYVTGGVNPVHGREAFESIHPGLTDGGPVALHEVFDVLSEDIGPSHWVTLAEEVKRAFEEGTRGVVVTHGTDTLAYTASALAFQLRDLPGPVVLVGAQRSIDRPSSDGVTNLLRAVRVARESDLGEVIVLLHAGPSDDRFAIHRGTRVRKMHSTRRDAFRSRNGAPLGILKEEIEWGPPHRPRSGRSVRLLGGFDTSGVLLWAYPGLTERMAAAFVAGSRGVILAGTGMGHVSTTLVPWIRSEVRKGIVVAMTTQCLEGMVDPFVYSRGRELLDAGVLYLGDMLAETAYVKLCWALHQSSDPTIVKRLLAEDVAGEIGDSRPLMGTAHP